jgi:hypothetical protein
MDAVLYDAQPPDALDHHPPDDAQQAAEKLLWHGGNSMVRVRRGGEIS